MAYFFVFIIFYMVNIIVISIGYHRALAHGSIELVPWLRRGLFRFGPWITGIDPKSWVFMHRLHHRYSDTERDPHSPIYQGIFGVFVGQLKSYKKSIRSLIRKTPKTMMIVADIPEGIHPLIRQGKWYYFYTLQLGLALAISLAFRDLGLGVAQILGSLSHPVQGWLINSLGHSLGYRNFQVADRSKNNWLVGFLLLGEGFQNNHHADPQNDRFSYKWWEIDTATGFIWFASS